MAGYGYNPFGGSYGQPSPQAYAMQAYMQQQAGGMGQMPQQPAQMQQINVVSRLVTSREEATTAQISFDINTFNIFYNPSAGEVYIKRFNPNTGGAFFEDFLSAAKLQAMQQAAQEPQKAQTEYATVDMVAALETRVSELADAITNKRTRGAKADE